MTSKGIKIFIALIILLILAGVAYWHFFLRGDGSLDINEPAQNQQTGFAPFGRNVTPTGTYGTTTNTTRPNAENTTVSGTQLKPPVLRLLSDTPVAGYGASTTGNSKTPIASTTTAIRWFDRGRGNVYEARGNTNEIQTLSNTVVPKMYESIWNKNLTSFLAFGISETNSVGGIWAELKSRPIPKTSSTTPVANASLTPYELKGKNLPDDILAYALSPARDRAFVMVRKEGTGVGYIFKFDGSNPVQIFNTPITQVNAEWPEEQTIALTTKGAADERGYLYFVNPKTGVWKKIIGPFPGLSTKVSRDAKKVFVSAAGSNNNVVSSVYDVSKGKGTDAVIRTLADKCVWGNLYKDTVYCAVPSQPVAATYPDDWYKGNVSFVDKIWQVNSITSEVHEVASLLDTADRTIDAFNLGIDDKDNYLIFMNKNDLSLWSLDLTAKR